jgi:hypothetical protein
MAPSQNKKLLLKKEILKVKSNDKIFAYEKLTNKKQQGNALTLP